MPVVPKPVVVGLPPNIVRVHPETGEVLFGDPFTPEPRALAIDSFGRCVTTTYSVYGGMYSLGQAQRAVEDAQLDWVVVNALIVYGMVDFSGAGVSGISYESLETVHTNQYTGVGGTAPTYATERSLGGGGQGDDPGLDEFFGTARTTDTTSWQTIATIGSVNAYGLDAHIDLLGKDGSSGVNPTLGFYRASLEFSSFGSTPAPIYAPDPGNPTDVRSFGTGAPGGGSGGSSWAVRLNNLGNGQTQVQVQGLGSDPSGVYWACSGRLLKGV